MQTGKVEYAPDYESKPRPNMTAKFRQMAIRAEWQQLRDAVASAAREWRVERLRINGYTYSTMEKLRLGSEANAKLSNTIDMLMTFEREHGLSREGDV